MSVKLEPATPDDAAALAALRTAVAEHLTRQYGTGPWSSASSEKGVLYHLRTGRVLVARSEHGLIASLTLATRKPWAIDKTYFSDCQKPLYLTDMAVRPDLQRSGIGRRCLEEAQRIAREWPADAIRLDAFDAAAGAGDFYRKCGFREVGRVTYRNTPLIYFERLL
ncbi:MAG TPA: GNAT family N-acetyltransferase [Thermoanaerobaculia bacterium]|nr:GNAT family N-acetyltransferase [Thermoanaerobaculia bacterium]